MHQTTVLTELICRYQRQWNDFTSQDSSVKMSRLHCITPWQGRKTSVLSEVALRAVKKSDGFVFLCRKHKNGFRLRFSPCGLRCSRPPPVSNHPFGVFGSFFVDTKKAGCFHIPRILRLSPFFINENGSGTWIRTKDQVVNSHLLYR